ncbi:MAG: hypothetical protein KJO26_12945, partial [Deltaproteobacteria bacterium]|nr:hypothetical protein [Deltaproteobacteria bacterium]
MLKKTLVIALLVIFLCLDGFAENKKLSDVDNDASEILLKVSNILAMDNVRSEQLMTVCRKDGSIRQYRLRIMTSGSDKVFAEIVKPKQFK